MLQPTFQDTLYLLAHNGYAREAYHASKACKETFTDERIIFPYVLDMKFGKNGTTLIGIYAQKACWYKNKEKELVARVKHLISLGANPDISDNEGVTPLKTTCFNNHSGMEMFNFLLSQKVRVNGDPSSIWNPLSLLASNIGTTKKVVALLSMGANPNYMINGTSVLHLATSHNDSKGEYVESIKLLLKAGADPNIVDRFGKTPIDSCIDKGYIKYANLLLDYGAVIYDTEYLMERAIEEKMEVAIKFLRQRGEPIPQYEWAAAIKKHDIPLITMLLRCGVCPVTPINNRPPILLALYKGFNEKALEVMKLLCKYGADVNTECSGMFVHIWNDEDSGTLYGGKLITRLFEEYIHTKNPYALKMVEMFVENGGKLPSKEKYKKMISESEKDLGEFVQLNRIYLKAMMK